jgi:predicted enzyme related to lactoylglutathione lyase
MRPIVVSDPLIDFYARDAEALARWYGAQFGFTQSFRCPLEGRADHIEVRLGALVLGFSTHRAARRDHGLKTGRGTPRGEIALRVRDVDAAFKQLTGAGAQAVKPPHFFFPPIAGMKLRAAWLHDPEGNRIQLYAPAT